MANLVVSNIRFPKDEWIMLKTAASLHDMSANEYIRYLTQADALRSATGTRNVRVKTNGYKAMQKFLDRKIKDKPIPASKEDKIIYDI